MRILAQSMRIERSQRVEGFNMLMRKHAEKMIQKGQNEPAKRNFLGIDRTDFAAIQDTHKKKLDGLQSASVQFMPDI